MRRIVLFGALTALLLGLPAAPGTAQVTEAPPTPASGLEAAPLVDGYRPYEAPRGAAFIDFGARVAARPANSPYTCRTAYIFSGNAQSCSWEAINFFTGESFQPPLGQGRITQVFVRAGNVTGPMRVEVIEAMRPVNPNGRVCCRLVRRSQVFTPQRNRVTTINVNLPIFQSRRPNAFGFYIDQRLALSVLRPNVPIPGSLVNNTTLSGWYPAWARVGQERYGGPSTSGGGVMPLLRARWRPA
jgi:hypothetical protein